MDGEHSGSDSPSSPSGRSPRKPSTSSKGHDHGHKSRHHSSGEKSPREHKERGRHRNRSSKEKEAEKPTKGHKKTSLQSGLASLNKVNDESDHSDHSDGESVLSKSSIVSKRSYPRRASRISKAGAGEDDDNASVSSGRSRSVSRTRARSVHRSRSRSRSRSRTRHGQDSTEEINAKSMLGGAAGSERDNDDDDDFDSIFQIAPTPAQKVTTSATSPVADEHKSILDQSRKGPIRALDPAAKPKNRRGSTLSSSIQPLRVAHTGYVLPGGLQHHDNIAPLDQEPKGGRRMERRHSWFHGSDSETEKIAKTSTLDAPAKSRSKSTKIAVMPLVNYEDPDDDDKRDWLAKLKRQIAV